MDSGAGARLNAGPAPGPADAAALRPRRRERQATGGEAAGTTASRNRSRTGLHGAGRRRPIRCAPTRTRLANDRQSADRPSREEDTMETVA